MKKQFVLIGIALSLVLMVGCATPRKFTVVPVEMESELTVSEELGAVRYTPVVDSRSEWDKKGKVETSCMGGSSGVTHLGDKNYENPLLPAFNEHLKKNLVDAHLFSAVLPVDSSSETTYVFSSSLDKFHVIIDESSAKKVQACIGGLMGALISSRADVTATSYVELTGMLKKNDEEIWRNTVSKQITEEDDYSDTRANAEWAIGRAIGEICRDLITDMAKSLASK